MGDLTDSLKEQLKKELLRPEPDFSVIADLTEKLLALDVNTARFSVDAHHIQRLGFELVGKQETALSELIKNAYDADASVVRINFSGQNHIGGKLLIEDDGVGMTEAVVRNSWMRLSTDEKSRNPLSDNYSRLRAGKKGIGRFAAQRLGTQLILETRVAGAATGIRVTFDWDKQFTPGRSLFAIANPIEQFTKDVDDHGTRLIINNLRDKWSDATLERVWKSVLLLQPPFKLANTAKITAPRTHALSDPGFQVIINGRSGTDHHNEVSIDTNFLNHAIATIEGSIDQDGNAVFHVRSDKIDLDETYLPDDKFLMVGPLSLETRYFIYSTDALSGLSATTASQMGRQYGGIRIYRNGFRVLPYGEPHDDWLRLSADAARRVLLVPASNSNFFGHVEISAEENILLEETSSREGLIENDAFVELQEFARACVEWAALRVAAARERKLTAGQKDFVSKARQPKARKPSEVLLELRQKGSEQSGREQQEEFFKEAEKEFQAYEEQVEAEREALLQYESMLRILSSLGISISIFGHEVKGANAAISGGIQVLKEAIDDAFTNEPHAEVISAVEGVGSSVNRLISLGNYVAALMSSTGSRELKTVSVSGAVERFVSQFADYMHKQGVEFDVDDIPPNLRTTEIHPSELDSVLFNFLTNALKAIKRAKPAHRKIRISACREGAIALLSFEDNGTGVAEEIRDRIFDAFYTTTFHDADDIAGPGTGLGLRIVSDIARSYGGSVSLGEPTEGYNCRFDFRILAAGGE